MKTALPIVTVLVPAAGSGARMGGRRKQYRNLGGAPLLVQTLQTFEKHPRVDHIVVAAPEGDTEWLTLDLRSRGFRKIHAVTAGGASRQASVAAALAAAPPAETVSSDKDIVLVHDAVRPFVPAHCIDSLVFTAVGKGAGALALPVSDTLRRVSDGMFGDAVNREGLYRMQTPQAFRRAWLEEAHRAAQRDCVEATDDAALVRRIGHPVILVEGSSLNIKVTTRTDYKLVEIIQASSERIAPADA